MTRRGILLAYKILGPLAIFLGFIVLLDELGIISVTERGLGEFYTLFAVVMYGIVFSVPVFLVVCPIIVVRFFRDLPVMLPALLLLLSLAVLFVPLFAGLADDFRYGWAGGPLLLASVATAIWSGYFAPKPRP